MTVRSFAIASWLALALVVAPTSGCGGGDKDAKPPAGDPDSYEPDSTAALDDTLSAEECAGLLDHVLEVSIAEVRKDSPKDVPDADKQAQIRATLHQDVPRCQQEVTRADYRCAMGATTRADIEACAR